MSLDSGRILWRLNHVLLPEPGSPIDSTTAPFGFLDGWAGGAAGAPAGSTASIASAASAASPVGPPGVGRAGAWAAVWGRLPRPRRPRRRKRSRLNCCCPDSSPPPVKGAGRESFDSGCVFSSCGCASKSGCWLATSSRGGSGNFGCKGAGFSCPCFSACCLRRLPRSRIHLRMLHL